jgi:hypothetical protein
MTSISSGASLIAPQNAESRAAGAAPPADSNLVQASFSDILGQVQAVVTGKPRTGFNSNVTNSLTAQTSAIRNQAGSAIDSAISRTKSLFSPSPKTGFHP